MQLAEGEGGSSPDAVLVALGGCGLYQVMISATIQAMKIVVCWGMVGNVFISYEPRWRCADISSSQYHRGNSSAATSGLDSNWSISVLGNGSIEYWNKQCRRDDGQPCEELQFDSDIRTLVSEFSLVCDQSWVTASVVSIQMAGMCVGSIVSGQLADLVGRKRPLVCSMAILSVFHLVSVFSVNWAMFAACRFFIVTLVFSMAILSVFHLVSVFSVNWAMFAACRFFIGIGSAFFLTIYCTMQAEFTLSRWRAVVIGFPSWALESSVFALVAWLLPSWRSLALVMAAMGLAFTATYCFLPESFRWLVTKNRMAEVDKVAKTIARWNRHPAPNPEKIQNMLRSTRENENQSNTKCLIGLIDLFRLVPLLKLTLPLMISWITMGFVAYGINFGVKKLSGNIFLNIFLFSVASIPSKIISIWLQNRFGRKVASIVAFLFTGAAGLCVGILLNVETAHRATLINTFALIASAGVDGTWGPMQTLTVEVYPTVVRNVGFGFASVLGRLGAVIGPQFVYLGESVPGILYFAVAGLCVLSVLSILCLPETNNTVLLDNVTRNLDQHRDKEGESVPGILYFAVAGLCVLSVLSILCLPETNNTVLLDTVTRDLDQHRDKEVNA